MQRRRLGQWRPGHVGGAKHFRDEVAGLCDFVRSCPTVEGVHEILLPGDPERRVLAERTRDGVPLDDGNWAALVKLASQLDVPVPAV